MLKAAAMILVATTLIASGNVLSPRRNVNVAADIDVVAVEERACATEGQSCRLQHFGSPWVPRPHNAAPPNGGCCSGLTCQDVALQIIFQCKK